MAAYPFSTAQTVQPQMDFRSRMPASNIPRPTYVQQRPQLPKPQISKPVVGGPGAAARRLNKMRPGATF